MLIVRNAIGLSQSRRATYTDSHAVMVITALHSVYPRPRTSHHNVTTCKAYERNALMGLTDDFGYGKPENYK